VLGVVLALAAVVGAVFYVKTDLILKLTNSGELSQQRHTPKATTSVTLSKETLAATAPKLTSQPKSETASLVVGSEPVPHADDLEEERTPDTVTKEYLIECLELKFAIFGFYALLAGHHPSRTPSEHDKPYLVIRRAFLEHGLFVFGESADEVYFGRPLTDYKIEAIERTWRLCDYSETDEKLKSPVCAYTPPVRRQLRSELIGLYRLLFDRFHFDTKDSRPFASLKVDRDEWQKACDIRMTLEAHSNSEVVHNSEYLLRTLVEAL
jgi:hypothetical protein